MNYFIAKEGFLKLKNQGDILLLYSRAYAWLKVKRVPLLIK
jgi:hypothetical protein